MSSVDLIISKYNEDLEWLQHYSKYPFTNIYIYDKSDRYTNCPRFLNNCSVIKLKNVGLCDHTYLYHIIHNYDNLSDYNIFIPASAYINSTKKRKLDSIFKSIFERKAPIISGNTYNGTPTHTVLHNFTLDHWAPTEEVNRKDHNNFNLQKSDIRPFGDWYKNYFSGESTDRVSYLGMFGVTREMIQEHTKEKYISLIKTVETDKFPEAAHYMERSWASLYKNTLMEGFTNNSISFNTILGMNILYLGVVYLIYTSYKR